MFHGLISRDPLLPFELKFKHSSELLQPLPWKHCEAFTDLQELRQQLHSFTAEPEHRKEDARQNPGYLGVFLGCLGIRGYFWGIIANLGVFLGCLGKPGVISGVFGCTRVFQGYLVEPGVTPVVSVHKGVFLGYQGKPGVISGVSEHMGYFWGIWAYSCGI